MIKCGNAIRVVLTVIVVGIAGVGAGCGGGPPPLMPTPNLYAKSGVDPFPDVPPALQNNRVEVMYVTDRAPEKGKDGKPTSPDHANYGTGRSRSTAFGVAEMQIGKEDLSWDELVQASRSAKRKKKLDLTVVSARELARFAPTPPKLILSDEELTHGHATTTTDPAQQEAEKKFIAELTARLAKTPRKEVFLFIHGHNVGFHGGIFNIGELWHFLGREGVPMSYSWPAGQGMLRAYGYSEQSTRFTIFHLKQTLRLIASCPAVEKVNIIAHSRGTAVTSDAVRELVIEIRGTANPQKTLKLGTAVLAAGDIDIDVVFAQNVAERDDQGVERTALYISEKDDALGISKWLTGGSGRLGSMDAKLLSKDEIKTLRHSRKLQIIDADVKSLGSFGHSYFLDSPEVTSDLILLLRYQLPPGGDGRPLGVSDRGFWIINDGYPGKITAP
ncbi:MAG: alpha/beta hydrolase [Tepidisphaeraceae bacterium]